jgi:hypothetical protein
MYDKGGGLFYGGENMEIFTFNGHIVVRNQEDSIIYIRKTDVESWSKKFPCFSIKNYTIKEEDADIKEIAKELEHYKRIHGIKK